MNIKRLSNGSAVIVNDNNTEDYIVNGNNITVTKKYNISPQPIGRTAYIAIVVNGILYKILMSGLEINDIPFAGSIDDAIAFIANNVVTGPSDDFTVLKLTQTIDFTEPTGAEEGDDPIQLEGVASSGLAVSYESSDEAVATVDEDGLLTIVAAGTTDITATQTGNDIYNAATPVIVGLTVTA